MAIVRLAMAQINPLLGDIHGNTAKIADYARRAQSDMAADIVIFPELSVTGYPPEDLLLRSSLRWRVEDALNNLCELRLGIAMVIGYPRYIGERLYNMAGVLVEGKIIAEYAKQCLPNYQVFDEKRYFSKGEQACVFEYNGARLALTICEDIWDGAPLEQIKTEQTDLLINLNASPFHQDKHNEREQLIATRAQAIQAPIIYVNQVGGQDELVFDGGSMACDAKGTMVSRSVFFEESLDSLELDTATRSLSAAEPVRRHASSNLAIIYQALVLGVRDYVNKNGFKGVVLGLSGGIDSALTLALACDALGSERVQAVMMPFTYTSQMSLDDAAAQAKTLGVTYRVMGIEPIYDAFMDSLGEAFAGTEVGVSEQNIQSRSRGVLLMALSNKLGYLVLTTGNKSEMAVGYATIYGDMAGGLDVLKDVPKTSVFELAKYRNTLSMAIPERVIERPPSAELAPDQKDEDSLPPYEILDQILERYVELDQSAEQIISEGFEPDTVKRVLRLVDINEYKRRQAPIGIRISRRAFGRDRRYPITNGWAIGD